MLFLVQLWGETFSKYGLEWVPTTEFAAGYWKANSRTGAAAPQTGINHRLSGSQSLVQVIH